MANTFARNELGDIVIDGTVIPRSVFCSLEPSYTEIENLRSLSYTKGGPRSIVTDTKQYSIDGIWESGERYLSRYKDYVVASAALQAEAKTTDEEVRTLVENSKTPRSRRKSEYPPLEDLIVALWENLIEKKSKKNSGIDQIQKLRKAIKAKYPTENQDAVNTDEEETN